MRDTDATGIVFHPRYLEILTSAREELYESLGFGSSALAFQHGSMIVVSNVKIRFLQPLFLRQRIVVITEIKKIVCAKIVTNQKIFEIEQNRQILDADMIFAHINKTSLEPQLIPQNLIDKIKMSI
jgi:acyl-CoA thioester hydrolase